MKVDLGSLPSAKKLYSVDLTRLDGGLNLWDVPYRVETNQSPNMKNMWWIGGALGSRQGQDWILEEPPVEEAVGYTMTPWLFEGQIVAHIGTALYAVDPEAETPAYALLISGVPENRGSFFIYDGDLFYKNRGGYFRISADEEGELSAEAVEGYTPVTVINANPTTGAGSLYQPENRIQSKKTVWYTAQEGVKVYHLPVTGIDSVEKVVVNGTELESGYAVDKDAGTVTFNTAPSVTDPPTTNAVRITYSKANDDAMASIMDCRYGIEYGGNQDLCVVLAGCEAQTNAYFWSGNTDVGPDPSYFPIDFYNLTGDTYEAITGFGKQQSYLIILSEHSVGRASFGTTTVDGRTVITMNFTPINAMTGCDLPWTIQLVENNIVWCNTKTGVHFLSDASSAYETNIKNLSRNVNGSDLRPGLLHDVQEADADTVCSVDDEQHYWIVANGHAYVWDYIINGSPSDESRLSWFYFTNIGAVAFCRDRTTRHLDAQGRLSEFREKYADYDQPIGQEYEFSVQFFGSYYQLKDVREVIFTVRSDTNSTLNIEYRTDYEVREDLTPIHQPGWTLVPRNLSYRALRVLRYAITAVRKPGCRNIRHFSMRIYNNNVYEDMSLLSAQIFYTFMGVDR